ncbi:MAG TPA: TIGR01459 family HAD-type hydrolase [Stellaceae bacterium]|nr:TIGR01459 family HAD-type hydrolase [Stellaceae bacterium]
MTETIDGMALVAPVFDAFILDQYGVLHDGIAPYAGVLDALRQLAAAGKPVAILSNSGKRAETNRNRLIRLGIPARLYSHIVTSGEVTWQALRDRPEPFWRSLGRRCLHVTRGDDHSLLDGLDLERASSPAAADFVLASGIDTPARSVDDYRPLLAVAAERGLPMVCANPDRVAVDGGRLIDSVGALAALYESLGGRVRYVGKPWPEVFAACLDALGTAPARTVMVGDNPETDIAGAQAIGLATIRVLSGVPNPVSAPADRRIDPPDFILSTFRW